MNTNPASSVIRTIDALRALRASTNDGAARAQLGHAIRSMRDWQARRTQAGRDAAIKRAMASLAIAKRNFAA